MCDAASARHHLGVSWSVRARVLLVLGACVAAGCPSAELALSLDLKTDLVPGTEFGAVRTELFPTRPSATSVAAVRADAPALRTDAFATGQRAAE